MSSAKRAGRSFRWWLVGGMVLSLAVAEGVSAAPPGARPRPRGGPKPSGKAPKARPAHPGRPPVKGRAHPPKHRGKYHKPHYYRGKHRYWHPVYTTTVVPKRTYTVLGYPYYVGGTNYTTVVEVPAAEAQTVVTPAPEAQSSLSDESVRYSQVLELTEMVHEWRTMNESPEFQARVAAAEAAGSAESRQRISDIKAQNQRFDRWSREAMQTLVAGKDADGQVAQARKALERLTEIAEALPGAAASSDTRS